MAPVIRLLSPDRKGKVSLETALARRRSVREYVPGSLALKEISQILWAAQGITGHGGLRAAPSAGALYPLELYLVAGNIEDLHQGVYRYDTAGHGLETMSGGNRLGALAAASLGQECVGDCAAAIVISADYEKTTWRYGRRGIRYVHMEVGCVAENIHLQAVALGLGTVFVGAFSDGEVKKLLNMPDEENPLGIMPVGRTDNPGRYSLQESYSQL